jgi:hypothetical protein
MEAPLAGWILVHCKNGYFYAQHGFAPASGPCPTMAAATRSAVRNLRKLA